jgi:hypothetical protein
MDEDRPVFTLQAVSYNSNIFDAPVFNHKQQVQAEPAKMPSADENSPLKPSSYLKQTASSKLKSRENSSHRVSSK